MKKFMVSAVINCVSITGAEEREKAEEYYRNLMFQVITELEKKFTGIKFNSGYFINVTELPKEVK
jgi:hypothetical protein